MWTAETPFYQHCDVRKITDLDDSERDMTHLATDLLPSISATQQAYARSIWRSRIRLAGSPTPPK